MRADVIPQLADAAEVLERVDIPEGVAVSVLIPNERGLDRALALREGRRGGRAFDEINVFLSASETHNRKNVNRSIAESLAGLEGVLARAREAGLRCEGVISTSFGCPYEGHVPPERVLDDRRAPARRRRAGDRLRRHHGDGQPAPGRRASSRSRASAGDDVELTAHFHNTRGAGLANALAALQAGVDSFESSFGELGGCPVPAGATGNIATEDLVSMLHEMGIGPASTCRADRLRAAAQEILGRPLGSHTLVAGPVEWDSTAALPAAEGRRRLSGAPGLRQGARADCSLGGAARPVPLARALSRIAATQNSCTATSISSVARARGGRRRRSRAWRGRPRRASWRAAPRPAPRSPAPAPRARRRG